MNASDEIDLEAILEKIRTQAIAENIRVTQHAQQEMSEENITLDEVLQAIATAQILENYPEHKRGACCLLNGIANNGRFVHIVCTTAQPILVTVQSPRRLSSPRQYSGVSKPRGTERLRLFTQTAEMGNSDPKEAINVKCSIVGCPGEYEVQLIIHTIRYRGQVMVFDHVPAEVCSVCGDVLLRPGTVRRIEALSQATTQPARSVPLYEFAY